ncbi:YrhK family protein [Alkalibacterium kapii]|uniref:YrhK domain-containing protein n=1 Tax=Alkalibacterium kapii TaxID=426704 RepID=A0A511AQE9_9LACT|nr:YrhK family protein [Alkalibacterium kapii]GEK90435.1 hypothetical protein AKA01nite_00570 [Alkalibacterium kapii]
MGGKDLFKPKKPEIEKKERELDPGKAEDVIVKIGTFRIYFQNYYTIVSLINDLFTGGLYLIGSILQTFTEMKTLGQYLFIFAGFFLLMRPVLKIIHNVFFYEKKEHNEEESEDSKDNINKGEKSETSQNGTDSKKRKEINKSYNDDYYDTKNKKE